MTDSKALTASEITISQQVEQLGKEYQGYLELADLAPETKRWYRARWKQFTTWIDSNEGSYPSLDALAMRSYFAYRKGGKYSDETVRGDYRALSAIFNWAIDEELIDVNPLKRVALPRIGDKATMPFTPDEIDRMIYGIENDLQALDQWFINRDVAIILLLFDTGIRSGGCRGIKYPDDIDMTQHIIRVLEKGNKERYVSFGDRVHETLIRHLETRPQNKYLFSSRDGKQMSMAGLYWMVQKACELANVPRRKLHMLRYSYACEVMLDGMDTSIVQTSLGHSEIRTTQHYTRFASQRRALQEQRKHSPADRLPSSNPQHTHTYKLLLDSQGNPLWNLGGA
ncbi:MAG: tyrosine-type recombinase/integrase [Chloroflexi bacterium]|nr:tyrosine-type recombinase/integrase [Chloroflexota bacterium]